MKKRKINLKINDEVKIIAGNDKGKIGKVLFVNRYKNKIQVQGIAMNTRYKKVNPYAQKSEKTMQKVEGFIDISNVQKVGGNNE